MAVGPPVTQRPISLNCLGKHRQHLMLGPPICRRKASDCRHGATLAFCQGTSRHTISRLAIGDSLGGGWLTDGGWRLAAGSWWSSHVLLVAIRRQLTDQVS